MSLSTECAAALLSFRYPSFRLRWSGVMVFTFTNYPSTSFKTSFAGTNDRHSILICDIKFCVRVVKGFKLVLALLKGCLIQSLFVILSLWIVFQCDRLPFEDFSSWLLKNPDVTTLTRWLLIVSNGCSIQLTDSSETPTFFQTLSSVTHCKLYYRACNQYN